MSSIAQFFISKIYECLDNSTTFVKRLFNIPIFAEDVALQELNIELNKLEKRLRKILSDLSATAEQHEEAINKLYSHVNRKSKIIKAPIDKVTTIMKAQIEMVDATELSAVAYRIKRIIQDKSDRNDILVIEAETLANFVISCYGNNKKPNHLIELNRNLEDGYK